MSNSNTKFKLEQLITMIAIGFLIAALLIGIAVFVKGGDTPGYGPEKHDTQFHLFHLNLHKSSIF